MAEDSDNGVPPWRDEETLREAYAEDENSMTELAEEWGTSAPTILRWLRRFGIETRSPGEALRIRAAKSPGGNLRPPETYEGGDE